MRRRFYLPFSLLVCSILMFIALSPLAPNAHAQDKSRAERHEIRDRHWGRGIEPAQYLDLLEQIRRMPGEDDSKAGASLLRSTRWENIGPIAVANLPGNNWHGRMKSIRFYNNPVNGNMETYLGASSGGLWFGNFAGLVRIWTSLGDNLPNPAVGAFLIDPLDPNVIWVGTGDKHRYAGAGLYKTTNRGATWFRVVVTSDDIVPGAITGLEFGVSRDVMYMSTDRGFFLSENGGVSWSLRGEARMRGVLVERMAIDPRRRDRVYLAIPYYIGLYASRDGGRIFHPINDGISLPDPQSAVIAISPSSPDILYAAFSNDIGNVGTIYRTTNRGDSWDSLPTPPEYLHSRQAVNDHAIVVSPTDPNRVYIGGVGLMLTTDGGQSWVFRKPGHSDITEIAYPPLGSGQLIVLNDGGFYIHNEATDVASNASEGFSPGAPLQAYTLEDAWSNSKVMVSGLQDNGTVVTDRAGERNQLWWIAGGCDGGNTISIHPTNPSQIFFNSWCGPSYRLRSDDMGRTQVHLNDTLGNWFYVPIRLNKLATNYVFTISHQLLLYSTNSGTTWLRATSGTGLDFDTASTTARPRTLMVNHHSDGPTAAYVLFNYDAGRGKFIRTFVGPPGEMIMQDRRVDSWNPSDIHYVAADRWKAKVAYAMTDRTDPRRAMAGDRAKVYRTTDAGGTWTSITGNLPNINTSDIVSSPVDPNLMWVATELGVFKTRNGGVRWESFQNGLPMVAVSALSYIRGTEFDTLRIATFGRGYWSRVLDGNDPLITVNAGVRGSLLRDVAVLGRASQPFNPDTVVVVGTAGTIGHSFDGGSSFTFNTFPTNGTLRSVASSDPTRVTVVGDSGIIIHSATAGREWAQIASGVNTTLRNLSFSGVVGLAVGDGGTILRSTTSGSQWKQVHSETNAILIGLSQPSKDDAWVTGGRRDDKSGAVVPMQLRTTDGGATWIEWQTPPAIFSSINMFSLTNGYGAGVDGVLYATTDGGSSWTAKPTGLNTSLTDLVVAAPGVVYSTTLDGRIIRTDDNGKSWTIEEVQAQGALYAITQGSRQMFAVGDSMVVILRDGPAEIDTTLLPEYITVFPMGVESESTPGAARIESIVPNPSSGETTIRFTIAKPARVSLTIHTMLGVSIARLPETSLPQGSHSATWDGNDAAGRAAPAGSYLIRVAAGGATTVDRIVIVR